MSNSSRCVDEDGCQRLATAPGSQAPHSARSTSGHPGSARIAVGFSRPGALAAELAGIDLRAELRHYTRAQAWVFVPFSLLFFTLA